MTALLLALGATALLRPGRSFARSSAGRPGRIALLDAVALAVGLLSIMLALGLSASVGVLHVLAGSELATYDGHLVPGGIVVSAASGVALSLLGSRLFGVVRRGRRGRRSAHADRWLGDHHDQGDHDLVVLPTTTAVAYSVRGARPQIVISRGFRDGVGPELLAFVVDHERAHLRGRHRAHLLVAVWVESLFGWIPAVARSALALRLTVERAADEEAAGADLDRRLRASSALRGLARFGLAGCASEALSYRAGLLARPSTPERQLELATAAGVVTIALLMIAIAGHIGGDVPQLLAALR